MDERIPYERIPYERVQGEEYPQPPFFEGLVTPEEVQREIRRTRHRWEVPLYLLLTAGGLITSVVMVYQSVNDEGLLSEITSFLEGIEGLEAFADLLQAVKALLVVLSLIGGIGGIVLLLVTMLVALYKIYGEEISYGIRVSERNFPEIYAKVKEYSYLLGLKKEPEVYIQQDNGMLNAFTAWVPGRAFIQLNAEIVDIAYLENQDFDTVMFVMGHEMGHIYLHHVQIYYTIWSTFISFVPIIGPSILAPLLSRAREYSADRVAQALTQGKNQEECMMLLGAGRHLYKHMDAQAYIEDIMCRHNIFERLGRWVVNLLASHPIMPFRTRAVLDPKKKSGRLL